MHDQNLSIEELCTNGDAHLRRGARVEAIASFDAALQINDTFLPAITGKGLALLMSENFNDALPLLNMAVLASPRDPILLEALGVAYAHTGSVSEAEVALRKALRFGRNRPETLVNLAAVLNESGKFKDAEAMLRNCLRRVPDNLQAQHNLSIVQLLNGEWKEAWPGFELRNAAANRPLPSWAENCDAPFWNGEDLSGKSILLYAEQGLGDTIQFSRYASLFAENGASVILQGQKALLNVLATIDGVSDVISTEDAAQDVDFKLSLLSAPGVMDTTPCRMPTDCPYISIDEGLIDKWADHVARDDGAKKVGLVWAGNPKNKTDYKRSIELTEFSAWLGRPGIDFFSLQVGEAAQEAERLPDMLRPHLLFPELQPFEDVAAAIANLDLLISVDTALAHLAGAIGKPVWTLITYFPDWRWMMARDDTPWYPSMRLFRQPAVGDWAGVIANVCDALEQKFDT